MTTRQAQELFLDGTLFSGARLRDWYAELEVSPGESMAEILRQVGYDLALYEKDRAARNSASYGARWMKEGTHSTVPLLNDLGKIWAFVEPIGNSGFDTFDAEFSGILLSRARLRSKKSVQPKKYIEDARRITARVGALSPESAAQKLVATAKIAGQDGFLRAAFAADASGKSALETTRGMLGRAFILGRYASASLRDLIEKSAVDDADLDVRFRLIGESAGIWSAPDAPTFRGPLVSEYRKAAATLIDAGDLTQTRKLRSAALDASRRLPLVSTWFVRNLDAALPVL